MADKNGAKPGEVCALCGDPMNAGYRVCGDCGAVRSVEATALCVIMAFAAGYFSWMLTPDVSGGVRLGIVFGVFVAVLIFGPQKAVYKKRVE